METKNETIPDIASQIDNAFNFIQKLYHESAYLVKEIEGHLARHEFRFQMVKPSGSGVTTRSSSGLDPNSVNFWLLRKFAFAFVAETPSEGKISQTNTEISLELKVIYFRIILNDKKIKSPQLLFGVFYDIERLKEEGWIKKFENLMGHFEYNDSKLFNNVPHISYSDSYIKLKGEFNSENLLEINSSEELVKKVIEPALKIYSSIN